MKSKFSLLDEKLEMLSQKRPLTEAEIKRLMEDFLIEYIYNSNAIEGNTLTLKETALVLKGLTIDKKPLYEHLEVIGHKEAFEYVVDLVSDKKDLSQKVIKDIHFLLLNGGGRDRGRYRNVPVRIMGSDHIPTEPYLIEEEMEKVLDNYHISKDHLVTRLARLHLEFESVHPFIDGNGRTGRLIVNLELMKAGFLPIDIKFNDREPYYNAFYDYHSTGSTQMKEEIFADYLDEALDKYLEILK